MTRSVMISPKHEARTPQTAAIAATASYAGPDSGSTSNHPTTPPSATAIEPYLMRSLLVIAQYSVRSTSRCRLIGSFNRRPALRADAGDVAGEVVAALDADAIRGSSVAPPK